MDFYSHLSHSTTLQRRKPYIPFFTVILMDIKSIIDAIVYAFYQAAIFLLKHPLYFMMFLAAIFAYAVASHLFFRLKGYQPREKTTCTLSIVGKERSLDYLKSFTHMPSEQIEIIQFLRQNESVSLVTLSKRFARHNVETLIRQGYIVLT